MTFRGGNGLDTLLMYLSFTDDRAVHIALHICWYLFSIFYFDYKTPTLSQVNVHLRRKDAIDNVLAFQVCAAIVALLYMVG